MSLARGTSGKKESLVPLNIDWSPTLVHIFSHLLVMHWVIYHMTWKLRMVPQNSSLACRTSVETCFTGPAVISLATDHRTSGFRDDCNGLSPGRHQDIIWTNAGIMLIQTLGRNFSEILCEICTFSFKKMHLKMSSAKWLQVVSAWICYYGTVDVLWLPPHPWPPTVYNW